MTTLTTPPAPLLTATELDDIERQLHDGVPRATYVLREWAMDYGEMLLTLARAGLAHHAMTPALALTCADDAE